MFCGERANVLGRKIGFISERHLGRPAHDEMRLDVGILQQFENPDSDDAARRAGDADDQTPGRTLAQLQLRLSALYS